MVANRPFAGPSRTRQVVLAHRLLCIVLPQLRCRAISPFVRPDTRTPCRIHRPAASVPPSTTSSAKPSRERIRCRRTLRLVSDARRRKPRCDGRTRRRSIACCRRPSTGSRACRRTCGRWRWPRNSLASRIALPKNGGNLARVVATSTTLCTTSAALAVDFRRTSTSSSSRCATSTTATTCGSPRGLSLRHATRHGHSGRNTAVASACEKRRIVRFVRCAITSASVSW